MANIHVSAERIVGAPADRVYAYIADHERHHHQFLPDAFSDFRVEEGGVGAGTVVSYRLRAGGRTNSARAVVAEPDPGRVMTETVIGTGIITTFTVLPQPEGGLVRIETSSPRSRGLRGWVESIMYPRILRPLYEDELARLDAYAREQDRIITADPSRDTAGLESSTVSC